MPLIQFYKTFIWQMVQISSRLHCCNLIHRTSTMSLKLLILESHSIPGLLPLKAPLPNSLSFWLASSSYLRPSNLRGRTRISSLQYGPISTRLPLPCPEPGNIQWAPSPRHIHTSIRIYTYTHTYYLYTLSSPIRMQNLWGEGLLFFLLVFLFPAFSTVSVT